jgi:hypothetical protein
MALLGRSRWTSDRPHLPNLARVTLVRGAVTNTCSDAERRLHCAAAYIGNESHRPVCFVTYVPGPDPIFFLTGF